MNTQPASKSRILVVEDETRVRELAKKVLLKNGYQVFVARTVKEAEAVLKHLVTVLDDEDVQGLEVQRPSLDEVFASIIKGK